jgi:EmrB/QacA subfamily drug resistance transporter
MAVVGVPMLLAPVLGPILGGLLVTHLSWRWIFFVNLPIGLVGLVLAAKLLPGGLAEGREAGAGRLDWRGLLLLSPGVALVVFGLSEVAAHGSVTFARMVPVLAGALLVVAFALRAWRTPAPVVDVRLFEDRGFTAAALTVFLVGAALFGSLLLLPLYFQIARGLSPLQAGVLMAPQGLGAALGMNRAGRLTDRIGGGPVVIAGLFALMLGTIAFTQVTPGTPYWVLELSLVARGIGLGFTMMPAMAAAYSTLERWQVPRATPMLNVMQRVGGSLGTAVLAVVLQHELAHASGRGAAAVSSAFAHTYWWALAITAVALLPAIVLAHAQRTADRGQRGPTPVSARTNVA